MKWEFFKAAAEAVTRAEVGGGDYNSTESAVAQRSWVGGESHHVAGSRVSDMREQQRISDTREQRRKRRQK